MSSEEAKAKYREQNGWGTDQDHRACIDCEETLIRSKANRYPISGRCPRCLATYQLQHKRQYARTWMKNELLTNKEFLKNSRKRSREFSRSKRLAFVQSRLAEQGWCCAACGIEMSIDSNWHRDHDHSCCTYGCNRCWRGVLCAPCNKALGFAEENPHRLRSLAVYAEKWSQYIREPN